MTMAVYDAPRTTAPAAGLSGIFSSIIGSLAAWNDARITRNAAVIDLFTGVIFIALGMVMVWQGVVGIGSWILG